MADASKMKTWVEINDICKTCDEDTANQLFLDEEKIGFKRLTYALRIHSRCNYLRAKRERELIITRNIEAV